LIVEETELPEIPNYHFALGGVIKSKKKDEQGIYRISEFELKEVSLVLDSNFKGIEEWEDWGEY
jgi:hypothetical protein